MTINRLTRYLVYGSIIALGAGICSLICSSKYQKYKLVQELEGLKSTRAQIQQVVESAENLPDLKDLELQLRKEGEEVLFDFQNQINQQINLYDERYKTLNERLENGDKTLKDLERKIQELKGNIEKLPVTQPTL